jgi:hypothetical protein
LHGHPRPAISAKETLELHRAVIFAAADLPIFAAGDREWPGKRSCFFTATAIVGFKNKIVPHESAISSFATLAVEYIARAAPG